MTAKLSPRLLAGFLWLTLIAAPVRAQDLEITTDVLDRFVTAYDKEKTDLDALQGDEASVAQKASDYRKCRMGLDIASSATSSRLARAAAQAAIRARCGAADEGDIWRDHERKKKAATTAAARAGNFTVPQFERLKVRLERIYAYGDRVGLKTSEGEAIDARKERFASIYGSGGTSSQAVAGALSALGGGGRMTGAWTQDYTWLYINSMFAMMYASGANLFNNEYQPGQWTRWTLKGTGDNTAYTAERAFLLKTSDGSEWWRFRSVIDNDTLLMEALFKPTGDGVYEIVRAKGKVPGEAQATEMMVPQNMSMINAYGGFGMRPTQESMDGATVGTESVRVGAGTYSAKLIRYGAFGGKQEWWLTNDVPGGWVKYQATDQDGDTYTMELTATGTGAKSELGVP